MKGKNKLVPRLLGITKESVMRVDEKTKDVVQEWPLTTVKRWAASPKSFTLVLCPQLHLQRAVIYTSSPLHYLYAECDIYNSLLFPPFFSSFSNTNRILKIVEISDCNIEWFLALLASYFF